VRGGEEKIYQPLPGLESPDHPAQRRWGLLKQKKYNGQKLIFYGKGLFVVLISTVLCDQFSYLQVYTVLWCSGFQPFLIHGLIKDQRVS
jgi:hypothetical protein